MRHFYFVINLILIWNVGISFSGAQDVGTPINAVMGSLSSSIEVFANSHQGRLPTSWQEIEAVQSFDAYKSYGVTSIPDNYILVSPPVFASQMEMDGGVGNGQIIVVGRQPHPEVGHAGLGRYVIYRMKNAAYYPVWLPEAKIQKIIAETHIEIPPPPVNVTPSQVPDTQASTFHTTAPSTAENTASSALLHPSSAPLIPGPQTPHSTSLSFWIYGSLILSLAVGLALWYYFWPKK